MVLWRPQGPIDPPMPSAVFRDRLATPQALLRDQTPKNLQGANFKTVTPHHPEDFLRAPLQAFLRGLYSQNHRGEEPNFEDVRIESCLGTSWQT